ncbi:sulfhydryl oxidase 2 [Rhynchocyon petersi]
MAAAGMAPVARRAGAGPRPVPPSSPRAPRPPWVLVLLAAAAAGPGVSGTAQLYRPGEDAVWVLDSGSVRGATANSSAAWLVQFYSSWCGHCIGYAPVWRALAGDVRDWAAAIRVAALDCAAEKNHEVCRAYGIHLYPTFRYFRALTNELTTGEHFRGANRELQTVRENMIDFLQNHTEDHWPPACPSLDPILPSDVLSLCDGHGGHYVAVMIENSSSYVGREVILDLVPYENVVVKRTLDLDRTLLDKLGVASVPSCFLIHPNGTCGLVSVTKPLRLFFSTYLKSLPGVRKKPPSLPEKPGGDGSEETAVWREFDKQVTFYFWGLFRLYTADLESALHHLLRVELAAHRSLEGEELRTLKDFITVVAKLFPGRPPVTKLLETLQEWLASLPLDRVPYGAILDLVNNKMRISGIFLTDKIKWVGCQGSRPELRGYPCALWKLFHTLTVQAAAHPEALVGTGFEGTPHKVLQALRKYIRTFFGCRECGEHFEAMAQESLDAVKSADQAVLWLWSKHNVVNSRLAGHLSEDPRFPKAPWPTPDLCPACHEEVKGLASWDEGQVLTFLKHHYSRTNLLDTYSADPWAPSQEEDRARPAPQKSHSSPHPGILHPPEALGPHSALSEKAPHRLDVRAQSPHGPRARGEPATTVPLLGAGFSSLDMSLCVLLYVASSLFLMVMYFFFRVRSKRWKVKYYPTV